ncbi:MAG: hypothetical protein HZA18_04945 [Nitrospirae bacterium]|nr:hypothetical protein [Nitrospirota bacterium]
MITQLVLVLIFFLPVGISAAADHDERLKEDNRLMELELGLASQPQIYLIFNLPEKQVAFKSRGIVLTGLKIRKVEVWGGPDAIGEYRLLRKSALKKPGRKEVRPGVKEGEFELEALELKDMPSRYRLDFEKGIMISVLPEPDGFISELYHTGFTILWYLSRPFFTIWNYLLNKPYAAMLLTMPGEDTRTLYWSFYEGLEAIIRFPYSDPVYGAA